MILVLFGQPNSGKTTLADEIMKIRYTSIHIDGDKLREIFINKDYSKEGRLKNLNRASDIATFINQIGDDVIMSLVYPYKEARDYLNSLNKDICWVYLTYEGERGRESFHVSDFDEPTEDEKILHLNTSKETMTDCINKIIKYAKLLG
jgi:adenylylsulfate kinase-like enzyme